jgi:hypothetical protein
MEAKAEAGAQACPLPILKNETSKNLTEKMSEDPTLSLKDRVAITW